MRKSFTPADYDKIIESAKAIYQTNNGKTRKDFVKAEKQAIVEFGYSVSYVHAKMKLLGSCND